MTAATLTTLPDAILTAWETNGDPAAAALAAMLRPVHPVHRHGAWSLATAAADRAAYCTGRERTWADTLAAMPDALAADRFTVVSGPAGWYVAEWGRVITVSCWGWNDRAGAEHRAAALAEFWPNTRAA